MQALLEAQYYNPRNPSSFGGPQRLAKYARVSRTAALNFLQTQDAYTRNKAVRHKFQRKKYNHPHIDYCWQADLIDVAKLSRRNSGSKFLLTVICTLSRFAFVRALRMKTGECVRAAFKDILIQSGRIPKYLQTDRGNEFDNKDVKELLKQYNIGLVHNHSPLKAAVIERFNRTWMTRLNKYFTRWGTTCYLADLQNIVYSYNHTKHSSIECAPSEVTVYNQLDIWLKSNNDLIHRKLNRPKYKLGEFVRMKLLKPLFTKGYSCTFSEKIYKISEVVNGKPVTYKLTSNDGTEILGIFYESEICAVKGI